MKGWVYAGTLQSLKEKKVKVVKGGIALFYHEGQVYALDNRCRIWDFLFIWGAFARGC